LQEESCRRQALPNAPVKQRAIAVVAVARELVGFLWAVMQDLPTTEGRAIA
jgi:hypothetical protein